MTDPPSPRPAKARRASRPRGGFSLVEALMMVTILAIGIGGLLSVTTYSLALVRVDEETTTAANATGELADLLQNVDFATVFAAFNRDPNDDPGAAGSAPGNNFPVDGLSIRGGDPDGFAGELVFPAVQVPSGAWELREDLFDPALGMPRDVSGDGVIDGANHAEDYVVLPVLLRVRWRGVGGDQTLEMMTLLSGT